ncbi:MAG: hypothetical protein KQH63_19400 [Desulfobulbaceae bacterium]|nr:hypothetical protein [Desulfobulbaceae bacterium]
MSDENFLKKDGEGYSRAVGLLEQCCTEYGFVASSKKRHNYKRIWGRDGAIISLAALLTGKETLISCAARTLETLAQYQGPHGEIPSNVDPSAQRISYGGTTGRVDSNLWFIIATTEYWQATGDESFLDRISAILEKTAFLLGAWEYNTRGLLYIPLTGDWADEYVHNGYVLYDQLLYLQALRSLAAVHAYLHGGEDHALKEKINRLYHLIRTNYWLKSDGMPESDVYHEILYKKGQKAVCHCQDRYWMPFFSPTGYGYRFDGFANVLASLFQIADARQQQAVDAHIEDITANYGMKLLPAFHPVITPKDEDWKELQMTFSYTFKNKPYEFQNGGLWPLVTGFYVADLARRGKKDKAQIFLEAVHKANSMSDAEDHWGFPEFIHGKSFKAGGTQMQCWSAAAAIIGSHALKGEKILRLLPSW